MSLKDDLREHRNAAASKAAELERQRVDLARLLKQEFKRLDPLVRSVLEEVGDGTWGRSFGLFRRYRVWVDRNGLEWAQPRWNDDRQCYLTGYPVIWEVDRIPTREAACTVGLSINFGGTTLLVDKYVELVASGVHCDGLRKALEDAFRPKRIA